MYFGVFGAVFLLVQFFQVVQGLSPFQSGLRTLPWTAMPAFVAPIAGLLAGRIGGRPILVAGMVLLSAGLAWIAAVTSPTVEYLVLVPGFVMAGIGMGLFFAPIANVVLSAVRPIEEGQASGATNTIREIGGVFGVAVLASVFSSAGSYETPDHVRGRARAGCLGRVGDRRGGRRRGARAAGPDPPRGDRPGRGDDHASGHGPGPARADPRLNGRESRDEPGASRRARLPFVVSVRV